MTPADVGVALGNFDLDKAPGESQLKYRHYAALGSIGHRLLAWLFTDMYVAEWVPEEWRHGVIFLTPKKAEGYTGDVDAMRPITLLDCASKLFNAIMWRRVQDVAADKHVLRGARFLALKGTNTWLPIDILHALVAQAQAHDSEEELWAYSEDKSKAFDTVPHCFV